MRLILFYFIAFFFLTACPSPKGPKPIFVDDPPPKGPSYSELSCFKVVEESHPQDDLISAALQNEDASLFAENLPKLESLDPLLYRFLSTKGGNKAYTIFMPTNYAWIDFTNMNPNLNLSDNLLEAILKQHIIVEYIPYKNLVDGLPVASSFNSNTIRFSKDSEGCVRINESSYVTIVEDLCSNGVIHLVDKVIIPDDGY